MNVVCHRTVPPKAGEFHQASHISPVLQDTLYKAGIDRLYAHQSKAVETVKSGRSVVVSTPTASGKSLIYNLPVLESIISDPDTRAMYLFPLKALTQDQHLTLNNMAGIADGQLKFSSAIYDGDTDHNLRRVIRQDPPNIILTNPDMLHRSFLPYHRGWSHFLSCLKYIIVDEVHTYRGVMGSNMAWVFRRLRRICSHYGQSPIFIFSSATIRNPDELAAALTGIKSRSIRRSSAPHGKKHFMMVDPLTQGAAAATIKLLHQALQKGLRTIVYTQSRKMTELIALWSAEKAGEYKDKISAYRAGFLPEQRRDIEARLASGDLLAVVSTSALELGIDIGHLDVCLLVGYPGSIMASWQRAGRVGRSGKDSAVVLIGHEDALDQYFLRHPEEFFAMEPESAVINPYNSNIMARHIVCAASELPLRGNEDFLNEKVKSCVEKLQESGVLIQANSMDYYYTKEQYPHKDVDLRGSGQKYGIFDKLTGEHLGDIDQSRVFHDTHPGAVYLHMGKTFQVQELSIETFSVFVSEVNLKYYTKSLTRKVTEIIETYETKTTSAGYVSWGRLKVTEEVVAYEKRLVRGQTRLSTVPLDLPPIIFETQGFWLTIDKQLKQTIESQMMHFMGGIHALEHCIIGTMPMIILTDRNDLGGISTPAHEQLGQGAVFVYDGIPGGIGLSSQAFVLIDKLLDKAMSIMSLCSCENGCPACVHSPKCGSGNRPLDKTAAMTMLAKIAGSRTGALTRIEACAPQEKTQSKTLHNTDAQTSFAVLDIETRLSAQEVGGWGNTHLMGVSCAVVYDSISREFRTFLQDQSNELGEYLSTFDCVVGFNLIRFDYRVLRGQSKFDFFSLPTLDILIHIEKRLGHRLSLNHLAMHTLKAGKSADGLMALKWWKEGKMDKIIEYCIQDVAVTRDLYLYGLEHGHLIYQNKAGSKVRLPVNWQK